MCENMSLLSYLGLIFSLIAVTLFVIIYSYKKMKGSNPNIVDELRQRSVDTYETQLKLRLIPKNSERPLQ